MYAHLFLLLSRVVITYDIITSLFIVTWSLLEFLILSFIREKSQKPEQQEEPYKAVTESLWVDVCVFIYRCLVGGHTQLTPACTTVTLVHFLVSQFPWFLNFCNFLCFTILFAPYYLPSHTVFFVVKETQKMCA